MSDRLEVIRRRAEVIRQDAKTHVRDYGWNREYMVETAGMLDDLVETAGMLDDLLAELDAAEARLLRYEEDLSELSKQVQDGRRDYDNLSDRLAACEQELESMTVERDYWAYGSGAKLDLARAEEALRTCTTFSALARAYFAGKAETDADKLVRTKQAYENAVRELRESE